MQFKGSVFVAKMAFTERDLRKQEPPISRDPIAPPVSAFFCPSCSVSCKLSS